MNIGRNGLKHEDYLVSSERRPEIVVWPNPAALVEHVEAKLGLVEMNRCRQVVNDKEGCNTVLLDLRIFARRDDSAREPSKPGGKANARELTAES